MRAHVLNKNRIRLTCVRAIASCAAALVAVGCSPTSLLDALVPDEGYTVAGDLAYGDDARQRLDVYVPDSATPDVGRPVVVWFYGGSWRWGDRGTYRFVGEALTKAGAVVVVPDYRLYPEVTYPAFVEDGAMVVRWIRQNIGDFGGDPDTIFLAGHSAGAHIAALLALDERFLEAVGESPRVVRGLIGFSGPYTFDPFDFRITRAIFASVDDADVTKPITYVNASAPPALLLHGKRDRTVHSGHSLLLASELGRYGVSAQYVEYPNIGHIGIVLSLAAPFRGRDSIYEDVTAFLRRPPRPATSKTATTEAGS